jgi:hypothetical protein
MSLDPVLAAARRPDGSPRFYPHGQHPATYRHRMQLAALERHGMGESEAADYVRLQLAVFEEGETLAKWRELRLREGPRR